VCKSERESLPPLRNADTDPHAQRHARMITTTTTSSSSGPEEWAIRLIPSGEVMSLADGSGGARSKTVRASTATSNATTTTTRTSKAPLASGVDGSSGGAKSAHNTSLSHGSSESGGERVSTTHADYHTGYSPGDHRARATHPETRALNLSWPEGGSAGSSADQSAAAANASSHAAEPSDATTAWDLSAAKSSRNAETQQHSDAHADGNSRGIASGRARAGQVVSATSRDVGNRTESKTCVG
jgi:hypothetical protein